jgi:hypothetical protein
MVIVEARIKNAADGSSTLTPATFNIWGYFWGYIKKLKILTI